MSLIYAQMGMRVASALGQFDAASHEYKMAKINRDYQEAMSNISAALQLNVQTENEISARDAAVRTASAIQVQSMRDQGSAAASAAAAGVAGGSVAGTMRGLMRSRLKAKHAQRKRVEEQARAFTQQRRNIALARAMNKDVSVLPKPSAASALLGLSASLIDIYDDHQPEGSQIADHLSRLR